VREGEAPLDGPLVEAARRGERQAMKQLYDRHGRYIAGLSARLLRSREEAEEVLQDTFVQAFTQLEQLRDGDAFRPWLAQIAVRLARRRLKKQRLFRFFGIRGEEDASLYLLSEGAPAEARSELRRLDEALLRVPEEQRIAWMLRHVEGEPLEQVAQVCGCSLATVKRWIDAADVQVRRATGKEDA
jgi:RNA polymerase sigma-70 factor (ECF subfamily)